MNIQIFGTKKCKRTKKAERFFKERSIPFHFVDLNIKAMSEGELDRVAEVLGVENLLDKESKAYKSKQLQYMEIDTFQELLDNPLLLKTPVVRNGREATVGDAEDQWKKWIKEGKR